MGDVRDHSCDTRDKTDTSLKAERAGVKGAKRPVTETVEIRFLDDLIERERLLADERLFKSRARADELLARERLAAPTRDVATTLERRRSDDSMRAERRISDTLLNQERDQADVRTKYERARNTPTTNVGLDALRRGTDASLQAERDRVTTERERSHHRLAMVAHDLRSPLAVVTLSAGFLVDESTDATTKQVAHDIDRCAARMERLILDLLDVARIDTGTLGIVKDDHDIVALLDETSRSYHSLFASRDLSFEIHAPPAPLMAAFDHDRIVQVLSNLLGNALKFTPAKGTVSLLAHAGSHEIEFEIRDNGAGISADALPHLFERFWQADDNSRRGLGLGLYLCREVVEQHGGRIWIESTEGLGTTVHFTLPTTPPAPVSMSA